MKCTLTAEAYTVATWDSTAPGPSINASMVESHGLLILNGQPLIILKTLKLKMGGRIRQQWKVSKGATERREDQALRSCCK